MFTGERILVADAGSSNQVNVNSFGGAQISGHAFIAGGSISQNVYRGSDGETCTAATTCIRFGPGLMIQAGGVYGAGITAGETTSIEGLSVGVGGDIGAGSMVGGQITVGESGVAGATGHGGGGAGFSFGIDFCYTSACTPLFAE